ncbi:MAG: histidine--tRNA ligase [Bacteriovoracaceae bacterium]|nr:histidine--tRNA ligase [Bacteriovoracaceae bacterium]
MSLSKQPYKGTRDLFPTQKRLLNYVFQKMRETAESFGYEPYDGPLLEETDLYRAKSGEELINEQIYSFIDRGEREVAIRPEMTPTLARMIAQIHRETPKPIRWYAIPNLMRYERPQKGRLREHWQFNCDVFGAPEAKGELEILQIAVALMKNLGADGSHFEILINDRRIVEAMFTKVLKTEKDVTQKIYKIIDRSKKVSKADLDKMIAELSLSSAQVNTLNEYLELKSLDGLKKFSQNNHIETEAAPFIQFITNCQEIGLGSYISIDAAIVRGLDYYTGVVFEIFDKNPENRRAICGGGAYGNLLQIFNEPALAGVGFGLGDVTLCDFLATHKLLPATNVAPIDLFVSFQTEQADNIAHKVANDLRAAGLKVELGLAALKPQKIFPILEKKQIHFAIFIGDEELKNGQVQVKNLKTRDAKNFALNDIQSIVNFIC